MKSVENKSSFKAFASNYDQFGESFQFKLPGNKWKHGTGLGFFFTILLVSAILFQTYLKGSKLQGSGGTKILMSMEESYFNSSYVFSSDDGLRFAFGITTYDSNQEVTEDLDYGEIKAKLYSWGLNDTGMYGEGQITTHPCTEDELGITGNSSSFWQLHPVNKDDVEYYHKKLKCTNDRISI